MINQFARKNIPRAALLLMVASLSAAFADEDASKKSQAYIKGIIQENIRKDIATVQADLANLREEMKQLMPGDVALVDRAFKQLESLSQGDIAAAIASLKAAGKTDDVRKQLESLSSAYASQVAITKGLKDISGELSVRQLQDDATAKLITILRRQVAARNEVARIARANPLPSALRDNLKHRHEVVVGDQDSVADDVRIVSAQINDAAVNLPENVRQFMVNASAIVTAQKLAETSATATALTKSGPLDQALPGQDATIKTLAAVIHSLSSDEMVIAQLKEISSSLGDTIDSQKNVAARMAAGQANRIPYDLQKRQIDTGDISSALSVELQALNNKASEDVRQGWDAMEKVVAVAPQAKREDKPAIAQNQSTAIASLEAAKKEIDGQIALLETKPSVDIDKLISDINDLKSGLTATPATDPKATADDLQKDALPISPEAAASLGDTAAILAQPPTPANTEAAIANLDKALKALGEAKTAMAATPGAGPATAGTGPGGPGAMGPDGPGTPNTAMDGSGTATGGGTPQGLSLLQGTGSEGGPVQVVTGITPKDREAIAQLQSEKPPRQFIPQVQQYYKSLSDGAGL